MRFQILLFCCALAVPSYAAETLAGKFSDDSGVVMFESFQYSEAEQYFTEQVSAESELYELSLLYLAKLSLLRNEGQQAVDFIEGSLAIEPNSVHEMILAGDAYCTNAMQVSGMFSALRLGRRCGSWYTKAADEYPESVQALRTAIQFHIEAPGIAGGSKKKAEEFLKQLTEVSEEDSRIIHVYWTDSNEGTHQALEVAIRLSSEPVTKPRTAYEFAMYFKEQEQLDKSKVLFEEVINSFVGEADNRYHRDALFNLGEMLISTGTQVDKGVALLEQYVANSKDEYNNYYFWSRFHLAKAYKVAGREQDYQGLVEFIQQKDYSHDSRFQQAFDEYISN